MEAREKNLVQQNLTNVIGNLEPKQRRPIIGYSHLMKELSKSCTNFSDRAETADIEQRIEENEKKYQSYQNEKCTCSRHILPKDIGDKDLRKFVSTNCCLLFNYIEPRDITEYPHQESVFTDAEYERIHSGITRKERFAIFLSILGRKTPAHHEPLRVLLDSIQFCKKYHFITSILINTRK